MTYSRNMSAPHIKCTKPTSLCFIETSSANFSFWPLGWIFMNTSIFTWLIFHFTSVSHCAVLLKFTTRWHSVKHLLYSAVLGPSAPQLSKCQFRMSDVQPQLRIFSCPIKNPFHIRSCTLWCAWNGTSDTLVHILSCATTNQSCLVAIWTVHHRCTELRMKWHLVSVFSVYMPVMLGLFTYLLVGGIYTVVSTCPQTYFSGPQWIIRGPFNNIKKCKSVLQSG